MEEQDCKFTLEWVKSEENLADNPSRGIPLSQRTDIGDFLEVTS